MPRRVAAGAVAVGAVIATAVSLAVAAPFGEDPSSRTGSSPGFAPSAESESATKGGDSAGPTPSREVDLPQPVRGERAVEVLGEDLPVAAELNGMEPDELRELLLEDPTVWLDESARVYFVDISHDEAPEADETVSGDVEASTDELPVAMATSNAFALHSNPGAPRTIFLDFDGGAVSETAWNSQFGVASGSHPGWDPAGDGAGFSSAELAQVRSVWARVAEDFAPFHVNVTTEDPGTAAIQRSGSTDQVYGTRVFVSGSRQASDAICSSRCGGVAYLRAFANSSQHSSLQPAWVFPHALGDDTKSVAEASSHEAGHNLGLQHDGDASGPYYGGHGVWAPIMGVGYNRPLVQWSRGKYVGANNPEDDLSLIAAGGAPLRADESGAAILTAALTLPLGSAFISFAEDQDTYALGICRGTVVAAASPAVISPNLATTVELLDSSGAVVLAANPPTTSPSRDTVTGLGATAVATVPLGAYYLRVSGAGAGDPGTGYETYGSLGTYSLQVTGCSPQLPTDEPSQSPTTSVSPTPTPTPTNSPTATATPEPTDGPTATDSPSPTPTPTQSPTPATEEKPRRPSAPSITRVRKGEAGGPITASLTWRAPSTANPAGTTYRVRSERIDAAGRIRERRIWTLRVPQSRTSATLEHPRKGRWRFSVQAGNDVGLGPWSSRSAAVQAR